MKKLALVAITDRGLDLGEDIYLKNSGGIDKFTLPGLARSGWTSNYLTLSDLFEAIFHQYQGFILIMATGIAVRVVAPFLTTKDKDPAVVVVDEKNNFAISLVSGHLGGANSLATELGEIMGCQPIITTATDLNNIKAIDVIARELDLNLEPVNHIKYFNKGLLSGEKITFWVEEDTTITTYQYTCRNIDDFSPDIPGYHVLVTHRLITPVHNRMIFLRPKSLFLGIGCRKDFCPESLQESVINLFQEKQLSLASIGAVGSIDIKKEEVAIVNLANFLDVPLITFSKEDINALCNKLDLSCSEFVQKQVGVNGVCEPCALLAGNTEQILTGKLINSGSTMAIAIKKPLTIAPLNKRWFTGGDRY